MRPMFKYLMTFPLFQIDAHVGGVNDIAFAHPNKQLCIVTCGDDKTIKVWDAVAGHKQYIFEGHEAPVHSVCPHYKENIQFIFSTTIDGKIKAWLYDCLGSRVDYDAPGLWCTAMAYSTDGTRSYFSQNPVLTSAFLFFCLLHLNYMGIYGNVFDSLYISMICEFVHSN
ncbi:protein TPR3-like [Camellia sinensis]|uniref:protein TPR3-like n=1 Tax=Camellia sinensis TaxID=4442 RepID=UPI001035E78B|nr:protein TPR3-like [Camellia sinensis]